MCVNSKEMSDKITIIYEPAEEGGYTAIIPEVPGAVSEGETIEEARGMVLDAMNEILEYRREAAMKEKSSRATVESFRLSA